MRIYLAGRYSRREELLGVRDVIEALGGEVTSRWLNGDHQIDDQGQPIGDNGEALVEGEGLRSGETFSERDRSERAAYLRAKFAQDDVEDVELSDMLIAFTEEPRSSASRGGRHVELGIALALAKRVIVVGPRENVFCWLPEVEHYERWATAALRVTRLLRGRTHPHGRLQRRRQEDSR